MRSEADRVIMEQLTNANTLNARAKVLRRKYAEEAKLILQMEDIERKASAQALEELQAHSEMLYKPQPGDRLDRACQAFVRTSGYAVGLDTPLRQRVSAAIQEWEGTEEKP